MQLRPNGCRPSNFAGIFFVVHVVVAVQIAGSIGCTRSAENRLGFTHRGSRRPWPRRPSCSIWSTLPLVKGAVEPEVRRSACLTYNAPGTVASAFSVHRKQLVDRNWQELPDGQSTDQFASATFARDGFSLAVTVFPARMPGAVSVAITHLGNLELDKLPVPGNAELVYPGAASAVFVTDMPVEQALEECRKLLGEKGWQPYGTAVDTLVLKQNAVRLTAHAVAAAGQAGKTTVSYSAALMSADLPAPADASDVQYNDLTTELTFDTTATPRPDRRLLSPDTLQSWLGSDDRSASEDRFQTNAVTEESEPRPAHPRNQRGAGQPARAATTSIGERDCRVGPAIEGQTQAEDGRLNRPVDPHGHAGFGHTGVTSSRFREPMPARPGSSGNGA